MLVGLSPGQKMFEKNLPGHANVWKKFYQVTPITIKFFCDVTNILLDSLQLGEQFSQFSSFAFNLNENKVCFKPVLRLQQKSIPEYRNSPVFKMVENCPVDICSDFFNEIQNRTNFWSCFRSFLTLFYHSNSEDSGDLYTDHLNTGNIWIPNFLKFRFELVGLSAMLNVPDQ